MSKKIGCMFAGQGAQVSGMGADLVEASEAAAEVFAKADSVLGWSVSDACFKGSSSKLKQSRICQPAIYTMSIACMAAFREKAGLRPAACGGLSLGEFAAAATAGVLDFETGLKLVAKRGELMQRACRSTNGAMAAVLNAGEPLVKTVCGAHDIDIANLNCPGQIVISGEYEKVHEAIMALKQEGVSRVIPLEVDGAFHSRLMQPAADAFSEVLGSVELSAPQCPFVQNFTGGLVDDPEEIRRNLEHQVTGSVRWEQCVQNMINSGIEMLVEFGPGKVLTGFMRRINRRFPVCNVAAAEDLEAAVEKVQA
ncbi:MAG: ACP S-malonyltransferase [Lentisphaeria bacterium]